MKRMVAIAVLIGLSGSLWAAPPPPRGGVGPRRVRMAPAPHPKHRHSVWGKGGENFWPGFIGGAVAGAVVGSAISHNPPPPRPATVVVHPAPVVVQSAPVVVQPVTTVQTVWVEGRYVDQVQPNGTVIRVWVPGHYEQRTVVVQ